MRALSGRVTTVLLLHVDGEGRVEEAHVERSSGLASLDEHARQWALSRWRYPALGTRFRTRVPFHFDP
jgi:TonB family protein